MEFKTPNYPGAVIPLPPVNAFNARFPIFPLHGGPGLFSL